MSISVLPHKMSIWFIMTFCVTKCSKEDPNSEEKNNLNKYKKLQCIHVCFLFHQGSYLGGTCTW